MSRDLVQPKTVSSFAQRAAIHEAGHAVMAVVLGCKVTNVDIVLRPRKGWGGCTHAHPTTPTQDILIGLAGFEAERLAGYAVDAQGAGDIAFVLESVSEDGIKPFRRVVAGLLRLHWNAVIAVRNRLLAKNRIRQRELMRVVGDSLVDGTRTERITMPRRTR